MEQANASAIAAPTAGEKRVPPLPGAVMWVPTCPTTAPGVTAGGRLLLLLELLLPAAASVGLAAATGRAWTLPLFYLPLFELLRPLIEHFGLKGVSPRHLPPAGAGWRHPEEGRTVIAVSSLLPPADKARQTAERLARLYNTNGQGRGTGVPAGRPAGCGIPTLPGDAADVAALQREIRRLNRLLTRRRKPAALALAVRGREYSETMRQYTGQERKRGAIAALVRVICGGENRFLAFEGDLDALRRSRYLLALDADTGLLMDTAARLVGALHPSTGRYGMRSVTG